MELYEGIQEGGVGERKEKVGTRSGVLARKGVITSGAYLSINHPL